MSTTNKHRWIVKVFDHRPNGFEISVVRRSFRLGRRSYGQFCEFKKLVTASDGNIPDWLFAAFKQLAEMYALKCNEQETSNARNLQ